MSTILSYRSLTIYLRFISISVFSFSCLWEASLHIYIWFSCYYSKSCRHKYFSLNFHLRIGSLIHKYTKIASSWTNFLADKYQVTLTIFLCIFLFSVNKLKVKSYDEIKLIFQYSILDKCWQYSFSFSKA